MRTLRSLPNRLFAPVDILSLVYFRIAFGAIMLWEVYRYFDHGWIARYWITPTLHFAYYGFDWVRPWGGSGMYLHWVALGALAILIMLGLAYRISATLFFLGFTYAFLLEQARYLNHFYLICLISFLMIFIPAHRAASLDALWRPSIRSQTAPAWALWLLRAQIGIAYFYGGVAKLNADWLRGEPFRMWLARRTDFPLIGSLFTEEWMVSLFNYGGLLFDLLLVPFLLWRRTRLFAFGVAVLFHLMNARLFSIGIFPWFMIAATALFFPPDWPRRLLVRWWPALTPGPPEPPVPASLHQRQHAALVLFALYLIVQCLVPLRHYLYPGNVSWTEDGHRFAWHMKLRDKDASALFVVTDPSGEEAWVVDPSDHLRSWQEDEMSSRPDMILQFAHYLADEMRKVGHVQVEVRAIVEASLNGREPQLLIDPTVDLAREPRTLKPASWIVPLMQPLHTDKRD